MWNLIRFTFCFALAFGQQQITLAWSSGELTFDINGTSETAEAVQKDLELMPCFINFGEVEKGEVVTRTLNLTTNGTVEVHLEQIKANDNYISTKVWAGEDKINREFKIETVLKSNAPVGTFSETMTLHTNSNSRPIINVPVYGNVLGIIRFKPHTLLLGVMEKGSHATNKLEVSSIDRRKFNILEIVSKPSFISGAITRTKSGSEFEITCKVEDNAPLGKLIGEIKIRTDDSGQPFVKVPFQGLITPMVSQQASKTGHLPSKYDCQAFKHIYITRPPFEEDTYLSAWIIRRFLDPIAEFVFVPIGSFVSERAGYIFDLPSPYSRWMRTNRQCTCEHILTEVKEPDITLKKMVDLVHQLEVGSWLVSPISEAGRMHSTITEITQGVSNPQSRIDLVFMYYDFIYAAGGHIPQ